MNYLVSDTDMTAVADAIRTAGGTSSSLQFPQGFVDAIGNLGGGGSTVIASGTFIGDGTQKATFTVGKKMPCTDFNLLIYADPEDAEFVYQSNYDPVIAVLSCHKELGRYDLSTDGSNKQANVGNITYTINNNGTLTNRSHLAIIGGVAVLRQNNMQDVAGSSQYSQITRASTGFTFSYAGGSWAYPFVSGKKFYWKIVYFGSDPTNDIVEVL